ncbi:MAG: hypothetical protein RI947_1281 [Candidatus Parcubacteria bacterium]|jgi:hypothetical protein
MFKQRTKISPFRALVNRIVVSKLEEIPFIVFLSFLLTFVTARAYVYLTNNDIMDFPWGQYVYFRGVHVHHLNFGIFILVIAGFAALYDLRPGAHRRLAVLYGIGLGLTFDEFALWLKLTDDYYARISYDAVIIIALILLNIIYFSDFWRRMGRTILRMATLFMGWRSMR